jgi:hypothetical protein
MMPKVPVLLFASVLAARASAQPQGIEPKAPLPLPEPPWLAHHLFESPWLFMAVLAAAGLVCYAAFSAAGKPRHARRGLAMLLILAAAVWGAATIVKTKREQAIVVTTRLVADVAAGDTRGVDAMLAPGAAVFSDQYPQGQGKTVIIEKVGQFFGPGGQFPLQDAAILESQAYLASPTLVQVQVKVRVAPKDWGFPIISWWRLDLSPRAAGEWQVDGIRYLSSNVPLTW